MGPSKKQPGHNIYKEKEYEDAKGKHNLLLNFLAPIVSNDWLVL